MDDVAEKRPKARGRCKKSNVEEPVECKSGQDGVFPMKDRGSLKEGEAGIKTKKGVVDSRVARQGLKESRTRKKKEA